MVRCALVCITKNDKLYLEEYTRYYLKLGFDTIFLYDNSDKKDLKEWRNRERIHVIWYPGIGRQIFAYNHFLVRHKKEYDYVAFFDSDEFLVLKKHRSIQDFCKERIEEGAIGINWYLFGNNGHTQYQSKPVLERFTKRDYRPHPLVKTIAKCSDIESMVIHQPARLFRGEFKNCRGKPISSFTNEDWDDSTAQLNHYCTKSNEEYDWKIKRGRAPIRKKRDYQELESYMGLNFVEDLWAIDFYNDESSKMGLAVVIFSDSESICSFPKGADKVFVYGKIKCQKEDPLFVYINDADPSNYQQHFLTNHKNGFEFVLFQEPEDVVCFDSPYNEGLFTFCQEQIHGGAMVFRSPTKTNEHRLIGKCRDLLEVRDYVPIKMGFGETVIETDLIFFS